VSHRSRRWLLRTAASSVALPFFASLAPRAARAQAAPPVRFIAWYAPNGVVMRDWRPDLVGPGYDLKPSLASLAPVQAHVSVISGLTQLPAVVPIPGDHARGTACFLTARTPTFTAGADIAVGTSIDQVIAQGWGDATALPSLELGLEGGSSAGVCDSGYACAYVRNISWAGPSTPRPKITDPLLAFDRLFAGTDAGLTEAERARRRALRASVLDHAVDEALNLQSRLGAEDRHKLDEYLTAVRALETRLEGDATLACDPGLRPEPAPDLDGAVRAMIEITALALECDLTRVVTFMLGNGGSNRSYDFLGVPEAHHELSHHGGNAHKLAQLQRIDAWVVARFGELVARLREAEAAEGVSLLDHTLALLSSEIGDGNRHNHDELPVLLAGAGGGAHTPGRHLVTERQPMANLFTSIAAATGLPAAPFGDDGTGPLPDLA
jgi:hypothetical protein